MNKIICGKCYGMDKPLEDRKAMIKQFKEGLNVCSCGKKMMVESGVMRYV